MGTGNFRSRKQRIQQKSGLPTERCGSPFYFVATAENPLRRMPVTPYGVIVVFFGALMLSCRCSAGNTRFLPPASICKRQVSPT